MTQDYPSHLIQALQAPSTPEIRITHLVQQDERSAQSSASYVLYWMIAQRRPHYNFGLQYAAERASALGLPLLILEPLRTGYPWASDRIHRFIIDGMRDNAHAFSDSPGVLHYPYLEPKEDAGKGLLAALAEHAAHIVTDDYPCFFIPSMIEAAAQQLESSHIPFSMVDSNGLLPLRATERVYTTAYSFRRALHKLLPAHLEQAFPMADPTREIEIQSWDDSSRALIQEVQKKWPPASSDLLEDRSPDRLADLPIDHDITLAEAEGGFEAAFERMRSFLNDRLSAYPEDRNKPAEDGASRFSPYLHFGHLSTHEVFSRLRRHEAWHLEDIADKPTGKREGWWNMSAGAESFLDELITWRELGYNMAHHQPDRYMSIEELPDFARETLAKHASDTREHLYSLEEFEQARTHDRIWNAAQNQLVETGEMHNYMRMLWGKKILEWTESPEQAAEVMIELNNKYAIDGRDPNSYSGIFWCLGRYDRGWQERDVFGKVRYMSSESTAKKYDLKAYLARYTGDKQGG